MQGLGDDPQRSVQGLAGGGGTLVNALLLAGFAELVALPCIVLWASFGTAIGRWLDTPRAWRIFNGVMGALTAACVVFILG